MFGSLRIIRLEVVEKLLKYGGSGMIDLLQQFFAVVRQEEFTTVEGRPYS